MMRMTQKKKTKKEHSRDEEEVRES